MRKGYKLHLKVVCHYLQLFFVFAVFSSDANADFLNVFLQFSCHRELQLMCKKS